MAVDQASQTSADGPMTHACSTPVALHPLRGSRMWPRPSTVRPDGDETESDWSMSSTVGASAVSSAMTDPLSMTMTRSAIESDYRDEGSGAPAGGVTHDARRNVQQANSYWASVLDPDEVALVRSLTDEVREDLEARVGRLA